MKTGLEIIAEERNRQIEMLGYSSEHDAEHQRGELAKAAAAYSSVAGDQVFQMEFKGTAELNEDDIPDVWPFGDDEWNPSDEVIRNLAKAGGIDRGGNRQNPKHKATMILRFDQCGVDGDTLGTREPRTAVIEESPLMVRQSGDENFSKPVQFRPLVNTFTPSLVAKMGIGNLSRGETATYCASMCVRARFETGGDNL